MENTTQIISREAITKLITDDGQAGPYVTLYVPTHRAGTPPNMTEDQIRLKNLTHAALDMLPEHQAGQQLAVTLKAKLEALEADRGFWESQTEGLLVCAHGTNVALFHLPIDTEEYAAVDDQYHLAPAMALASDAHNYYVLVLGQQEPVLLFGDTVDLRPAGLQLPNTITEALNLDEPNQKTEQQRSDSGVGANAGMVNGRGGARDPRQQDRQRFWRLLDHKIINFADLKLPIILAGTGSEVAEFKAVSNYPKILPDHIEGSFNGAPPRDLLPAAKHIIEHDIIDQEHHAAIEEYSRLAGANPERTANQNEAIDAAAGMGRIDTLLLGIHRTTTDNVRDDMAAVPTISFPGNTEQENLTNRVAQQVFTSSGRVLAIDQADMPKHAAILARLRY